MYLKCIINYPAKMAPKSEISHSGELNPMIPTPW